MPKLDVSKLNPGDVVVVKMNLWIVRVLVWIQELVKFHSTKYANYGHVIVTHHRDSEGRLWGIEANALGIGWVMMDKLAGSYGVANSEQPRDPAVNIRLLETMEALLGTPYDYTAYLDFALDALGITKTWQDFTGCDVPPHFICSAIADFVYEKENLPNPGGFEITRYTTPSGWARFILNREWNNA